MNQKSGFTLIELVLVIIILAILAAAALPKFVNLKATAISNSEENIFSALNIALKSQYMKNIADGMEPTTALIMSNNPFYYLEQSPAYANWFYPPDNATWRYYNYGYTRWYMFCPHYDATGALGSDAGSATKGKLYMYEGTYAGNKPPGTVWLYTDKGH